MIFVNLVGGSNLKIKCDEYDFILEFNEALKDRKAMKVVSNEGAIYINPNHVLTFRDCE